ncbi:MAG: hypothetical protein ACRDA8_00725 [Shewanella sp.]
MDNYLDHTFADYPETSLLVVHDPELVAGVGIEQEYWLEGELKREPAM